MKNDLLKELKRDSDETGCVFAGFLYSPTGSRYICNPPVMATDEDWIVWSHDSPKLVATLIANGFVLSDERGDYIDCLSYRKGDVNIIVIYDKLMYELWLKATEVCKLLNIKDKLVRKTIHRILWGEDPLL